MMFAGNWNLGFQQLERRTIKIPAGIYSNGTLFRGTPDNPTVIANYSQIDDTFLGQLFIDNTAMDGKPYEFVTGDKIDIVWKNRIDTNLYEKARLDEIETKGSSTMCNLSALFADPDAPLDNETFTGNGAFLELINVVRR